MNRRTAVLMKKIGADAALLPVRLDGETVLVDGEIIGRLVGFRFAVDPQAAHSDRKLLLAAAERHLPALLADRAHALTAAISETGGNLDLNAGSIRWQESELAVLARGRSVLEPLLVRDRALDAIPQAARAALVAALERWIADRLEPLAPLRRLEAARTSFDAGPELRALMIRLIDAGGMTERAGSGLDRLSREQRATLTRLGVTVGALDLFVPAMLKPAAGRAWSDAAGLDRAGPDGPGPLAPVLAAAPGKTMRGYRRLGDQMLRIDLAEKLLREAHAARAAHGRRGAVLDPARAVSMGLTAASYARLLRAGGFRPVMSKSLPAAAHGPLAPLLWQWRPPRSEQVPERLRTTPGEDNAFAALTGLFA